jgi:hypothetical protein
MSSSSADLPTPEGPGSVSGAPNLPAGFTGTFTSRYVDTGKLRLHAVTGGDGPPLLLVHGWPLTTSASTAAGSASVASVLVSRSAVTASSRIWRRISALVIRAMVTSCLASAPL